MLTLLGAAFPVLGVLWRFRGIAGILLLVVASAFIYHRGDLHGRAVINARWTAAEKAMQDRGAKAREDAELTIVLPPEEELKADEQARTPIGKPCKTFDRFDRDCAQ